MEKTYIIYDSDTIEAYLPTEKIFFKKYGTSIIAQKAYEMKIKKVYSQTINIEENEKILYWKKVTSPALSFEPVLTPQDWEYTEFPIRIMVKQNDLRYGEVLQNLTFDMLVDNPPQIVYWKEVETEPEVFEKLKFVTVYLKYLYSKDKFVLNTETNTISASSSLADYMIIEQLADAVFENTRINGKDAIAKVRS